MAMLTTEEVLRELEGKDEQGGKSLLTKLDLINVRQRFKDYAFTYAKKAGGHTVCSGCGGPLNRTVERHGDEIRCPNCRKNVQVYDEWRGHKYLYEQMVVYIWKRSSKDPETILAKAIHAQKSFRYAEDAPLQATVTAVYQFGPKGAKMYRHDHYRNGFYPNASSITPEENKHGYKCEAKHAGFWAAAEGTQLGEVADRLHVCLIEGQRGMHPVLALMEAARKPYLMYMFRHGQGILARDVVQGLYKVKKRKAKSMPELLGLTEGQWYEVRKRQLELNGRWLNALENIQTAGNMTITLADAWRAVENSSAGAKQRLADEAPVRLRGCTPKLRRKAVRRAAFSKDLIEWLDYWKQLQDLGEDMTDARILLPKDLHGMHQRMTDRLNAIKEQQKREMDAILSKEQSERMKILKELYSFEACGLILRPFENAAEVVAEGTAQHICIGGYADRYMQGKTILCALRRAECPEEPWRAIEFSATTGMLVQDRGSWNDRGKGEGNLRNGVEGWLKRFWSAFYDHQSKIKKQRRNAA